MKIRKFKPKNRKKGNNSQLIDLFSKRMELGNMTFGKQMPLDGTYNLKRCLRRGARPVYLRGWSCTGDSQGYTV